MVYTIIDEFTFLDYLSLSKEKLSKRKNKFKKTKFNNLYGLVITEIFINIISCHEFFEYLISTVILKYCNELFPYYLSKWFVIVETELGSVDNIPIIVKKNQCYSFTWRGESSNMQGFYNLNCQHIEQNIHWNRCVWKYMYNYDDNRNVEFYNLEFNFFFKQRLDWL